MELSVTGIINEEIKQREDRKVTSWNCSKLGTCLTGVYLERLGAKADAEFDDRTLRVFSAGKMFEEWVVNLVKPHLEDGMNLAEQVRVEDKALDVTGYADFVLEKGDDKLLYEVKSKNSRAFHYMDKKGEGANYHHMMQTWLYLYNLNIPKGIILYISKDDLCTLEYPVFLDDEDLKADVMRELDILNRAWASKLPPPVPEWEKEDQWKGRYCRFHPQCLNQEKYLK